jgi:phage-related minor tail protein
MSKQGSEMNRQSSTMNVRQYNEVSRAVKWMSDNTMGYAQQYNECQTIQWGKQSSKINRALKWINRAVKWINRAVKWMADNIMG